MTPARAAADLKQRLLAPGFDFGRPSRPLALKAFRQNLSVPEFTACIPEQWGA